MGAPAAASAHIADPAISLDSCAGTHRAARSAFAEATVRQFRRDLFEAAQGISHVFDIDGGNALLERDGQIDRLALGLSGVSSLGRPEEAKAALNRAEALIQTVLIDRPEDIDAHEELGWIDANRWTLSTDTEQSMAIQGRARAHFLHVLAQDPARASATLGLLTLENGCGYDLIWTENRPRDAVPVLRAAVTRLRATRFPPELARQAKLLEVHLLGRLGDALYYADEPSAAVSPYREQKALVMAQLALGPSVVWTDRLGETAFNLAVCLPQSGPGGNEALQELQQATRALRQVLLFGFDAVIEMRLAIMEAQQALSLASLGRVKEAVEV